MPIVIDPAKIKGDPRYYLGLPITGKGEISNANYLWMQMFVNALNPQGRAGFVMANSASDAGNAEKEMSDVDFDARMKELMGEFTHLTKEAHGLEQKIVDAWRLLT